MGIRAENHIEVGEDEADDEVERYAEGVVHCCPHLVSISKQITIQVSAQVGCACAKDERCFVAAWPGTWDVIQETRFATLALRHSTKFARGCQELEPLQGRIET